ncbi:MAG: hypothetical protein AB7P49_04615 [Bdellovibrionales bacterium]
MSSSKHSRDETKTEQGGEEEGFLKRAKRSFRDLRRGFFGDVQESVIVRAGEHAKLPAVNMSLRNVPRYLQMECVTSNEKRNDAFKRVFEKLETALGRGNVDLTAESVTCLANESDVNMGASYTIQCRYLQKKFSATRKPALIDIESIWSVSQFDADPDLKTILISVPTTIQNDGALQIDFHLVFREARPKS